MAFPNIWHHRKVADTASKSCDICYKPSTSVLVTPEKQDFFYVCTSHLKEKGFCSPIIDEAAVAAKRKQAEAEELERLKKEYEEKQRKKKEKEKEAEKDKDKEKEKEKGKDDKEADSKDEKPPTEKDAEKAPVQEEEPRVFALTRNFYQQRLDKKRQAEMAKRNRERLSNPSFFPSVPKDLP